MGVTPRRIEVEIQELVLHGFGPLDAARVAETVTRRLERSLAGIAAEPRSVDRVVAPSFVVRPGGAELGAGIARGIVKVLSP